ncbi:unnamed protein product, partial [Staurois parvus]
NFEKKKKKNVFLVFVIKFCKISDFSPLLMCANEAVVMVTDKMH